MAANTTTSDPWAAILAGDEDLPVREAPRVEVTDQSPPRDARTGRILSH